jgi:hypothetical protein
MHKSNSLKIRLSRLFFSYWNLGCQIKKLMLKMNLKKQETLLNRNLFSLV